MLGRILIVICLALMVFTAGNQVAMAAVAWDVPVLGSMQMPDGFQAVEIKGAKELMSSQKPKADAGKTVAKPVVTSQDKTSTGDLPSKDELVGRFEKAGIAAYHLTLNDGSAVHIGWFLAFRDSQVIQPELDVFGIEMSEKQKTGLEDIRNWINQNNDKLKYDDPQSKVSFQALEVLPIEFIPAGQSRILTGGVRVLTTAEGFPVPAYFRAYLMKLNDRLSGGVFLSIDGERSFWEPVILEAFKGLQSQSVR